MRKFWLLALVLALAFAMTAVIACSGDDDDDDDDDTGDDDIFDDDDSGDDDDIFDDDDSGDDDDDDCTDNTAPVLNEGYFYIDGALGDAVSDGTVDVTADQEFGILFDYEDADCNLDGGVMLIDFNDGAGFQEGPDLDDMGCSTVDSGMVSGYLLDLTTIDPGTYTTTTKFQDVCGDDSNTIDATFNLVAE